MKSPFINDKKFIQEYIHESTQSIIVFAFTIKALLDKPFHFDHSWKDVTTEVELRMVTCSRDIIPSLCAIKSFLRLSQRKMNIFIHIDGTLHVWQKILFKYHLPFVQFVEKKEERGLNTDIFPYITRLRNFWQGKKLVDMYMMKKTPKLLILDADVLFYHYPKEIIHWIDKEDSNIFMKDYKSFNVLSRAEYEHYFYTKRLSENINTGILGLTQKTFKYNLRDIEKYLSVTDRVQTTDRKLSERDVYSDYMLMSGHLLEQSVFCYLFGLTKRRKALSKYLYYMYPKAVLRLEPRPFYPHMPIAIHYAGQADRRNFYLDYLLQNRITGRIYQKLFFLYESLSRHKTSH